MKEQKIPMKGRNLEVIGSFGFGGKTGLMANKLHKDGGRKMSQSISKIVGFRVRNCAEDVMSTIIPVVFKIPVRRWEEQSDGTYKAREELLELAPGDEAIVESCDLFSYILSNKQEFGTSLNNGVIKKSSKGGKNMAYLKNQEKITREEAAYFCFSHAPNSTLRTHDPEVKVGVGYQVNGEWCIRENFKEYFGFLEEEVQKKKKNKTGKLVQNIVATRMKAKYTLNKEN